MITETKTQKARGYVVYQVRSQYPSERPSRLSSIFKFGLFKEGLKRTLYKLWAGCRDKSISWG